MNVDLSPSSATIQDMPEALAACLCNFGNKDDVCLFRGCVAEQDRDTDWKRVRVEVASLSEQDYRQPTSPFCLRCSLEPVGRAFNKVMERVGGQHASASGSHFLPCCIGEWWPPPLY